jgi:hypothetical protein
MTAQHLAAQTVSVVNTTLLPDGSTKVDAELFTAATQNGLSITLAYDKNAVKGAIAVAFRSGIAGSFADNREEGMLTISALGTVPEGAVADLGIITETVLERGSTKPQPFALRIIKTEVTSAVSIQPNRVNTSGSFRVVSPVALQQIALYDAKGVLVVAQTLDGSNTTIVQLPSLPVGVYLVKINNENAQKIVVE